MKKIIFLAAIIFIFCSQSLAQTRHSVAKAKVSDSYGVYKDLLFRVPLDEKCVVDYNASIFTKSFIASGDTSYAIWEEDSEPQPLTTSTTPASVCNIGLYPNPATSQVRLSVEGVSGMLDCTIIDMSGRVVYNDKFSAESPKFINLNSIKKGAYIVRITNSTFSKFEKLIVR